MPKGFKCDKCEEFFEYPRIDSLFVFFDNISNSPYYKSEFTLCKECAFHIMDNCINKKECE